MKKLHRLILTSATYQQSCQTMPEKDTKDAENFLLSRFNRARLDYEAMRDAVASVAGMLNTGAMGGRSVPLIAADVDTHRTVYQFVDRYDQATVPATFDFANPDGHSPQRFVTTVPQQALFLMNSPFMKKQADILSAKLPQEPTATADAETIKALYHQVLLREPKLKELDMAQRFVADAQGLQSPPAFVWKYGTAHLKREESKASIEARAKQAADIASKAEAAKKARAGAAPGDEPKPAPPPVPAPVAKTFDKTALEGWVPFKVLDREKKKNTWSPTGIVPDPQWHYAMLSDGGGHAAGEDLVVSRRWTAPEDLTIIVRGTLKRSAKAGNGVRGLIIRNGTEVLREALAAPGKFTQPMAIEKPLQVKKGDVLDFAVSAEDGDTNSDSFEWVPEIQLPAKEGAKPEVLTNAKADFCGKDGWPLNRPRPQSALAQLVQVLMMSNEFMFVE